MWGKKTCHLQLLLLLLALAGRAALASGRIVQAGAPSCLKSARGAHHPATHPPTLTAQLIAGAPVASSGMWLLLRAFHAILAE